MSDEIVASEVSDSVTATTPFKALLAASSLFVVVLGIAGFSLRWNYYYNFGLQDIVIDAPLSSLAVSSIEILRSPANVATLLLMIVEYLLPFQLLLMLLRWLSGSRSARVKKGVDGFMQVTGLRSDLLVDVIRAGLILFVAFQAGGVVGVRDYLTNVVERTSPLARVTLVVPQGEGKGALPITCSPVPLGAAPASKEGRAFIGSSDELYRLDSGQACSHNFSWRLLYRDEKFVYVFLTVPGPGSRPTMLAIPRSESLTLVLE